MKTTTLALGALLTFLAQAFDPVCLQANDFVLATGNPSLQVWRAGATQLPVWSLSGRQPGQSVAAVTPPMPAGCRAVRVEILVVNTDGRASSGFTDVYRVLVTQLRDGQALKDGVLDGKPVRSELAAPGVVRAVVLESYALVEPGVSLAVRLARLPDDAGDTFEEPAGLVQMKLTPLAAPPAASLVEDAPGYNSWPMIQNVGDRLVCTYSRGSGHTIHEGSRSAYARCSVDGGRTWTPEVCFAQDPQVGEVMIGKGLDNDGAALFWVRCLGRPKSHHDLYRTRDGVAFEKIAEPALDPFPMQITDVVKTPAGLMSLWFATNYQEDGTHSWGTLTSTDNGRTWTQKTVETVAKKGELPTEQSFVHLGGGRLLGIARTENGGDATAAQFQLTSLDCGKTWKKVRTNIRDVLISTPSLVYDEKTGLLSNYYYERGRGPIKRRVARPDDVFDHPLRWPAPETVAIGEWNRPWDSGNASAIGMGDRHYVAYYSGNPSNAVVLVASPQAPARR